MYSPRAQAKPRASRRIGGWIITSVILLALILQLFRPPVPSARPHQAAEVHAATLQGPPLPVSAPWPTLPFAVQETSGVLWDLNTHQLLWALHPHQVGPIASTTKLMTIYLALHRLSLSRQVTISPLAASIGGSDIFMAPGFHFSVGQLLYGLMLASANNAATALAQTMAPSVPAFVREMNQTAQQLGMSHTHYADPDGLSPQSVSTAWDLSIIAEQDLQNPMFDRIVRTRQTALPHNPRIFNLNGLLWRDPTVIGLKTGWTTAAGFNLVFAATRTVHGHQVTLLGVLLHGQHGFPPVYQNAESLLTWGFQHLPSK